MRRLTLGGVGSKIGLHRGPMGNPALFFQNLYNHLPLPCSFCYYVSLAECLISGLRKILAFESPFLFHLESSFHAQDVYFVFLIFRSTRKMT